MADRHSRDNMDSELEELLAGHRDRIAYPDMADSVASARERIESAARPELAGPALEPAPFDAWDDEDSDQFNAPQPITRIDRQTPGTLRQVFTLVAAALTMFIVGGVLIAVLPDVINDDSQIGAVLGPNTTGYEFAGTIGGPMIPNEPVDVAVDSQGNIYAADIATRSVQKFDPEGIHLASWTAADAEAGPFIRPWSLAIQDDIVYVLDQTQAAIYRLDAEGSVLGSWRIGDPNDPSLLFSGMDVNQHGHVYIASSNAGAIVVYDSDGTYIADIQVADDPQSGGERPLDVAVSDDGRIFYTSYAGNKIRVLDTSGTQIDRILAADLDMPESFYGITLGKDGFLYANSSRTVVKFAATDYQVVARWEFDEPVIGGLGYPSQGVAVDSDNVMYIPDIIHHRIAAHAVGSTDVLLEIKDTRPGRFSTPGGIKLDEEGSMYVVDSSTQQVIKFAPDGTLLDTWEWEADAALDLEGYPGDVALGEGHLYILDGHEPSIVKLTWSGEKVGEWTGSLMGQDSWERVLSIQLDRDGNIYLVNQGQSILKYGPDGEFLDQWHISATGAERREPLAMRIDGDSVYVAFAAGTMPGIWTLDLDGEAIERIVEFVPTSDGDLETFVNDLAIAPTGDIFTVDTYARTARWYSPEGELKSEWPLDSGSERTLGFPYIAVDNSGTVYISDGGTRQIQVFEPVSE